MNILSLDTSTEILSIALRTEKSYEERLIRGNFTHSEDLLAEIIDILERAGLSLKDLDILIAAKGPGSFTGLRVGIATLKGIRAAGNAKLVTVPTLDAMAESVGQVAEYPILPVIDAKKNRFYYALYAHDMAPIVTVRDSAAENISSEIRDYGKVIVTGVDADKFIAKITDEETRAKFIVDRSCPRNIASSLIRLGMKKLEEDGEDDIGEGPLYVRRSDAEEALLKKMEENNA